MGYYFVSEAEVKEKNKDINYALGLTLFLGIIGIHRFYLGRYFSGLVILVSLFLTSWQSLWVIIPLVIVEFIQLSVLRSRIIKSVETVTLLHSPQENSIRHEPVLAPARLDTSKSRQVIISDIKPGSRQQTILQPPPVIVEEKSGETGIYEVSGIETSVINSEIRGQKTEPPSHTGWVQRLELPYERRDLRIPQLKDGTYLIYEELAEYMDRGLRSEGSSLDELGRRIVPGGYNYYGNILYTIFCIAEGEVTYHYSGGGRGYDNAFSYQLLEARTNKLYIEHIKKYATELAEKLPPANDETRIHFRLTENGLPVVWWDMDGVIRESSKLSAKFIRILNITPPRNTKLYEIPEIREAIFLHYRKVITILEEQVNSVPDWSLRLKTYLDRVFDEKRTYVENPNSFMILNYILKLSEQAVRDSIPYARPLDTTKERASIQKLVPKRAAVAIINSIDDHEPLKLLTNTLELLRKQNPTAWKFDLTNVSTASLEKVITLLNRYGQPGVIDKVVKEVVRNHPDPRARLLALYKLNVIEAGLDEALNKKLQGLIHHAQLKNYDRLVLENKTLSPVFAEGLLSLNKAPRKHVVLSEDRLARAHDDHNHAIKSVVGYLGEDINDNDNMEILQALMPAINKKTLFADLTSEPIKLTDDQRQFIGLLVDSSDGIDASVGIEFARNQKKMLNGYIQSINKNLYERFEDQVIVQGDGRIVIEDEYVAAMKGLL